jgi:hypothetical protein
MNIGGLAARAALKQKPTKLCERCGLKYPEDEPACLHCKEILSEPELEAFKEKIDSQGEATSNLGSIFCLVALILGVLLFLSF